MYKFIDRVDDFCDREAGALLSVIASAVLNIDKMIIKLEEKPDHYIKFPINCISVEER